MGEALDDFQGEGGGRDVEALARFLPEQAEVVGGGENLGMDDLAGDGGQAFEGGAQLAHAAGAGLGRENFSRRRNIGPRGGVGLFCLVLEELQEELVMAHLLALGSVNALEQGGDDAFLDGELGFKVGDLGSEFFDLLFRSSDIIDIAIAMPIEEICVTFPAISPDLIPGALEAVAQVDAVGEHREGGGLEDEFATVTVDVLRPAETSALESFGDYPVAGRVEVEDLDEVAGFEGVEEPVVCIGPCSGCDRSGRT